MRVTPELLGEYLDRQPYKYSKELGVIERITFPDGNWISIQASKFHHCVPRKDLCSFSKYLCFEVMATEEIKGWEEFYDGCIYSYVPVNKICSYLEKKGKLPPQHRTRSSDEQ